MHWTSFLLTKSFCGFALVKVVQSRDCDGGYQCSIPKECCAQGCCYLYAPPSSNNTPKSPVPTDHILNLFFVNHWYFWCLILAIVFSVILFCSLWKKRRQLCGWDTSGLQSQSVGSGSYSIPPQYSRCSSFHQPPPYTEVTSKPDLYPLVFSYTGDGKTGTNYLMVQYFRNYIIRPSSLSGTSTVDSLSSSFICNGNAPPSYSRAQSPDASIIIRNHPMTRSASQACTLDCNITESGVRPNSLPNSNFHSSIIATPNVETLPADSYYIENDRRKKVENPQYFRCLNYKNVEKVNESIILLQNENEDFITLKNAKFRYKNKYDNNVTGVSANTSDQLEDIFSSCNSINVPSNSLSNLQMLRKHSGYIQRQSSKNDLVSRYESYMHSLVSSLANLESPNPPSPPNALSSPTEAQRCNLTNNKSTSFIEFAEIFEQIRQFRNESGHDIEDNHIDLNLAINGPECMVEDRNFNRPSSLYGKGKTFTKCHASATLKSPIEKILRKSFMSKSAPTTPNQPTIYKFDDSSPLLDGFEDDQT